MNENCRHSKENVDTVLRKELTGMRNSVKQMALEAGPLDDFDVSGGYSLGLQELWGFVTALQTAIEPNRLLEVFARELTRYVRYDGLRFQNLDAGLDIQKGLRKRHRCSLRILLDDELVGELSFYRATRFSAKEIRFLEGLASLAQHPLHNSVLYFRASVQARSDRLTSLGNRAAFDEFLVEACANREFGTFSIVLFDIDFFKSINDRWGHQLGDYVIQVFSQTLQGNIRKDDGVFRYGGEEFAAVLPRTRIEDAKVLAERIRSSVPAVALRDSCEELRFTISAGVTAYQTGDSPESIVQRADEALYLGKRSGRNCVIVSP